jgi:hypothetical protein
MFENPYITKAFLALCAVGFVVAVLELGWGIKI